MGNPLPLSFCNQPNNSQHLEGNQKKCHKMNEKNYLSKNIVPLHNQEKTCVSERKAKKERESKEKQTRKIDIELACVIR